MVRREGLPVAADHVGDVGDDALQRWQQLPQLGVEAPGVVHIRDAGAGGGALLVRGELDVVGRQLLELGRHLRQRLGVGREARQHLGKLVHQREDGRKLLLASGVPHAPHHLEGVVQLDDLPPPQSREPQAHVLALLLGSPQPHVCQVLLGRRVDACCLLAAKGRRLGDVLRAQRGQDGGLGLPAPRDLRFLDLGCKVVVGES